MGLRRQCESNSLKTSAMEPILVFFGLERSHYEDDCDISQIVMKSGRWAFNKYVDPTTQIAADIKEINHMTIRNSQIYKDKVLKRSSPLNSVVDELFLFLKGLNGPCTLIAHRCCHSNAYLLVRAIRDLGMENKFSSVIAGFTDTLDMFKGKFPDADPKKLNIHALAKDINLNAQQSLSRGRSIKDNAKILEKLALHHFTAAELKAKRSFFALLRTIENSEGITAKLPQAVLHSTVADICIFHQQQDVAEPPSNQRGKDAKEKRGNTGRNKEKPKKEKENKKKKRSESRKEGKRREPQVESSEDNDGST